MKPGTFGVLVFVFPNNITNDGVLHSWRWLNTFLLIGNSEFLILLCLRTIAFALPTKSTLPKAEEFFHF